MAAKKNTESMAAAKTKTVKTYGSLKALLSAKTMGTLPRGTKVHTMGGSIKFVAGGETILALSYSDFMYDSAKRLGFTVVD